MEAMKKMRTFVFVIIFTFVGLSFSVPVKAEDVAIEDANFPDAIFREYINKYIDKDKNGYLSESEILGTKSISIWKEEGLSNLTGIEHFTSITSLDCAANSITELDISHNTELENLQVYSNKLTKLDVSNNTKIKTLSCYENNISELIIGDNNNLTLLSCHKNNLSSLDVTNNPKLAHLCCYDNQLNSLDLSNNPDLIDLYCEDNRLEVLDVSKHKNLRALSCKNNNIITLNVKNNSELTRLYCWGNKFSQVDVSNQDLDNLRYNENDSGYLATLDKEKKILSYKKDPNFTPTPTVTPTPSPTPTIIPTVIPTPSPVPTVIPTVTPTQTPQAPITISPSESEIEINQSVVLQAYTSDPGIEVRWSSSNPEIATVSNGVVTGVSEGTAIIIAQVRSYYATASVTVTKIEDPDIVILNKQKIPIKVDKKITKVLVSNKNIVKVQKKGKKLIIKGKKAGDVVVTALGKKKQVLGTWTIRVR